MKFSLGVLNSYEMIMMILMMMSSLTTQSALCANTLVLTSHLM